MSVEVTLFVAPPLHLAFSPSRRCHGDMKGIVLQNTAHYNSNTTYVGARVILPA